MWLTGLSCPDFQTGGPSSASWSRLSFPMRPGRVGRGCRTLTITRLPPEAQAEVSWPFLAQPQRANYYLFMPPVFPPCNKRLLNEVSTKCLHLSQAVKDLEPEQIFSSIKFSKWVDQMKWFWSSPEISQGPYWKQRSQTRVGNHKRNEIHMHNNEENSRQSQWKTVYIGHHCEKH